MGKKSRAKTAKKKTAKKALKKAGKPHTIKHATKLVQASDSSGIDITSLASSAVSGIPFIGGLASNLIDQTSQLGTKSGKGSKQGLRITDANGNTVRRISMEDYFYLKSLARRRKIGTRHRGHSYAIVRENERVVRT